MTLPVDGTYYYDHDRIRCTRHGDPRHYTFQQEASIIDDTSPMHQVPSPVVDVMVAAALQYANPDSPSDVCATFEEQRVACDEVQDGGTQSSERIPETQFTPE